MKPEAQREALAKEFPNIIRKSAAYPSDWSFRPESGPWTVCHRNDPLLDLNAARGIEMQLSFDEYDLFVPELEQVGARDKACMYSASAAQRFEAILRTLNLWTDE